MARSVAGISAMLLAGTAMPAMAAHLIIDFEELNNSGVTGSGTILYDEEAGTITVSINATGLVPNQPHVGHIHGRFDDEGNPIDSVVPPPSADTSGDGFISIAEGLPFYGPVILPLAGIGDAVNDQGVLTYNRVFDLSQSTFNMNFGPADLFPLTFREAVLHGGFMNGEYVATLPVAAGAISAPVPEPATWAMMLLGFFGVGGMMRRAKVVRQTISYS